MFTLDLKKQTKQYHDSLENHIINQKLFQANLNFDDYCNFIDLQYNISKSLEEKIIPYKENLKKDFNIDFVSRASDAIEELQYINRTPTLLNFKLPINDTFESCLCALYILEGSRHGAMVILKKIKEYMPSNHQFYFFKTDINTFMKQWSFIVNAIESSNEDSQNQEKFITTVNLIYTFIQRFYDEYSAISAN